MDILLKIADKEHAALLRLGVYKVFTVKSFEGNSQTSLNSQ